MLYTVQSIVYIKVISNRGGEFKQMFPREFHHYFLGWIGQNPYKDAVAQALFLLEEASSNRNTELLCSHLA